MTRITWMRTHVPIRNGEKGISTSFMEPDYQMVLKDRVFTISKNGVVITHTGMENVVEFSTGDNLGTEEKDKHRAKAKA